MMRPKDHLWLGAIFLLLGVLFWPRSAGMPARAWSGAAGTRWASTELRGMQRWEGAFSNVSLAGEALELRCRHLSVLKTSIEYWPGPEWHGWAEWHADRVTYQPGWKTASSKIRPVSIAAPWWLRWCPS